jgi:putative flippase GtrA
MSAKRFPADRVPTQSIPRVVRFLGVGALNTLFGYAVFAGLTALGCPDVLSVPASMTVGIIFNFLSYGTLVFASLAGRHFLRFVAAYVCLYAGNLSGLRALTHAGLNAYAAQAILVLPLAMLAYLLNDRWVFRAASQ